MRALLVILFVLIHLVAVGITMRAGFEGPALLGLTIETNPGFYVSFGGSPPGSIFGGDAFWSVSVSGGYAHRIGVFDAGMIVLSVIPRIGLGILMKEEFCITIAPGVLSELGITVLPSFRIGIQTGVVLCLCVRIVDVRPELIPTGQVGFIAQF